MIRYIASNAFKIGLVRGFGTLCNLLLVIAITHNLELDDAGIFFVTLSVVTVFILCAKFGLDQALLKFHADSIYNKESNNLLGRILILFIVINLFLYICYFFFSDTFYTVILNKPGLSIVGNTIFLWVFFAALLFVYSEYMRAKSYYVLASVSNTPLPAFFSLILLLIYIYVFDLKLSLTVLVTLFLCSQIISLGVLLVLTNFFSTKQSSNLNNNNIKYSEILGFSTPIFLNHILLLALVQGDVWILSKFYSDDIVALYGASAKLLVFLSFFISTITGVLPPIISKFKVAGNIKELEVLVQKITTLVAVPCIITLLIIMCFSDAILAMFGNQYSAGSQFLIILCFSQLVNVLVGPCGYILVNFGFGKKTMTSALIWSVVAIASSIFIAAENVDAKYIALIFSIAITANQIHMWLLCRKHCHVNTSFSTQVLINVGKSRF